MLDGRRRDKGLGGYPEVTSRKRERLPGLPERAFGRATIQSVRRGQHAGRQRSIERLPNLRRMRYAVHHGSRAGLAQPQARGPVAGDAGYLCVPRCRKPPRTGHQAGHVHAILAPIWVNKHETATRVRSRIENVLDYAISSEYRAGPNPARLKANLDAMLPPSKRVAKVVHHAALQVDALPALMVALRKAEGKAPERSSSSSSPLPVRAKSAARAGQRSIWFARFGPSPASA